MPTPTAMLDPTAVCHSLPCPRATRPQPHHEAPSTWHPFPPAAPSPHHGRVLQHVRHNDVPHTAAADEDVLHVRHLAGHSGRNENTGEVGRQSRRAGKRHNKRRRQLQSQISNAPSSATHPAVCGTMHSRQHGQRRQAMQRTRAPLRRTLPSRAVACTFVSWTFQLSSASCSSPR